MKKIKYVFLSLFTIVFSITVFGQSDVVICNDCPQSKQERVAKLSATYNTRSIVVVDIKNETAQKFDTFYSEDRFGEPLINVYKASLNSNELYDLDLLYQYRKELVRVVTLAANKSMLLSDSVVSKNNLSATSSSNSTDNYAVGKVIEVKGSPYDFMTNSSIRNDIYDFYFRGSTNGLTQILSQTMKTIKFPNMNKLDVYIQIDFYSDDLGEVPNGFISVTLKLVTKSFDILGGRDGFNNSIPLTRADVNGRQFNFSGAAEGPQEKTKFESYIIPFGGGGGGGCSVIKTEVIGDRVVYTYQC
ncbi:hypothetical protein [Pseudoalteromonas sp. ASV78]|uniref:hypothetical protein n=1 Tax=Pseudoalteromonas sp. ASV78 TaxID=3397851 RepID=UPI0039FD4E54